MAVLVPNLRDLGGTRTCDGGAVRAGRLLRSAMPWADDLVPDGYDWPPRVVLDLRSPAELEGDHPLLGLGATVVNIPILSALAPGRWADTLAELYGRVLVEAPHHLIDVVTRVADADGATLIHCAAGKDRTGISVALLLALVGVEREVIVEDYLLTALAEAEIGARLGLPRVEAHFLETPVDAIETVLDAWEQHPEGALGWYLEVGGDPAVVERLRRSLLG